MIIGNNNKHNVTLQLEEAENMHILITGKSGSGKTCAMKNLIRMGGSNAKIVVLDFLGNFSDIQEGIDYPCISISVYENGLDINLFGDKYFTDGTKEREADKASRIVDIISSLSRRKLAMRQQRLLCHLLLKEFHNNSLMELNTQNVLIKICNELSADNENPVAQDLLAVLQYYVELDIFNTDVSLHQAVNDYGLVVLNLQYFAPDIQKILAEFVLWELSFCRDMGSTPLYIVIDEFQKMRFDDASVLGRILREGRNYNIGLWLASQFITHAPAVEQDQLMQTATQFYFKPADSELRKILSLITSGEKREEWRKVLLRMKPGQCIARGNFYIGESLRPYSHPFLVDFFCN